VKSEEFIREVDEELQRERLGTLWRRYGGLVVGLALLAVVGTAGKVAWDHWRQQALAEEAARFAAADQALAATRTAEAAAAFASIGAEGETGYAALARLREAEAKAALGDQAGAASALDALAHAGAADPILRDLGALLAAARDLDRGDPAQLRGRLEPLAAPGAPWRHHAQELLAVLAIRTGDLDTARRLLDELGKAAGVPQGQQRRAQELLETIGGPPQQASS
jgi:hypothetical protein